MNVDHALVAPHLQTFFAEHLCNHKRSSQQTIASIRDTFRLLLKYIAETRRIQPSELHLSELDAPAVLAFLDHLEHERGNSVRSRNLRLSAIRSFFRWVALREPQCVGLVTRIMAIPIKREDRKLVGYLTREEIDAVIAAPNRSEWRGRRDHALLLTMYNSGARVSEITALHRAQVHFGRDTFLQLNGKGRKERTIPLWAQTAAALKKWFAELDGLRSPVAFPNARKSPISRHGVTHILQRAVAGASASCTALRGKRVSPHLAWQHVNLYGRYRFDSDVRPVNLRAMADQLRAGHVALAGGAA